MKLRILRWGDCSRLTGWAQHNHKGPYKRAARRFKAVVGDVTMEARNWSDAGRGHKPRNAWLLEAEKGRKIFSP